MSIEQYQDLVMPTSIEDRQRVNAALKEAVNCMIRIKSEQECKKEIISRICADYELPKKLIAKAVKTMFNEDYQAVKAENENFETLLETLKLVPSDSDDSDEE